MARPAHVQQPGPALAPRVVAAEGRGRAFDIQLSAGVPLLESVRAGFEAEGFASGVLNIGEIALGPFAYVMPALSKDGRNAAFYSDTFRPAGVTRFERGALTFGSRGGAPFFHCHALWRESHDRRSGGHVLPEEAVIAEDAVVTAFGIDGAAFESRPDSETNFTLFGPTPAEPRGAATDRRAFALRLRPNQCFHSALEEFVQKAGWNKARIFGGVGSTIGALFDDGREVENFATEIFVSDGFVAPDASGDPHAQINVGVVDYTGALAEGRLKRGANRILMTSELVIAED